MSDPVGEHARLAGARPGEHEKRALTVQHGGALWLVQALEEAVGSGGRGHQSRIDARAAGRRAAQVTVSLGPAYG
jgi:hypothetical protein